MRFIYIINIIFFIVKFTNCKTFPLIISIISNDQNITSIKSCINSILTQNVERSLYKILLIVSDKDNNFNLKEDFLSFVKKNKIELNIINNKNNLENTLITSFKKLSEHSILLINDCLIYPEGWLEMFIDDLKKYPNDIIAGSIQYLIGQNFEIKNLTEGYNGKYFGKFNHITNLIFNFAFINIKLGGVLFPPNSFKNKIFYNLELFSKISSNSIDFWVSCFIMLENKILRQSSKIYDYTQYIINNNEFINDFDKNSMEKNLIKLFFYLPWFKNIIKRRQNKVIISLTSYPERFEFLESVIGSIRNQSFLIQDIKLILFKNEKKLFKYNIDGLDIIDVNEDLKPHKKYYYTMSKFRDYAILTLDDDTIYCHNMINSLYKSYIDHPNIVSGRGGHFMKYKNNGELTNYLSWFSRPNSVNDIDFNIFLIGVGGIIYPPDILNINESNLDIIKELLIGDDFVLKHLQIKKGIEQRLVQNHHPQGLYLMNNSLHKPLYDINKYNNDIYIKKINTAINNEIIKELCINYKNIRTGLIIQFFNINNIIINNTKTYFKIDVFSFCPIDNIFTFKIEFKKYIAYCQFNNIYSRIEENFKIKNTKRILVANCFINKKIKNFNKFLFPKILSPNNSNLVIHNKIKYIPIIYKEHSMIETNKYILQLIFFKSYPKYFNFNFELNNIKLNCTLYEDIFYKNDEEPTIKNINCFKIDSYDFNRIILISGLPKSHLEFENSNKSQISNIFIISKIYTEKINISSYIIIKGKLKKDLNLNIFDLKLQSLYPKLSLICKIEAGSKFIQSYIFCETFKSNIENIFLENQIIYSKTSNYNILLINNETLLQNYRTFQNNNDYQINNLIKNNENELIQLILIIIFLFLLFVKVFNKYIFYCE